MNILIAAAIALFVFFGGSGATVYAAQDSQPGQLLYPVKILSEDTLLALTASPQTQLEYTLDFADRRVEEIAGLLQAGEAVPAEVETRLQTQLTWALYLAAGMDEAQMVQQLEQVRLRTEAMTQAMTALMAGAPASEQPMLARLQTRLQEQVQLASQGQADPQTFRNQIQEQSQTGPGEPDPSSGNGNQEPAGTPNPSGNGSGNQPTQAPGQPGGNSNEEPGQNGPGPQQTPVHTPQPGGGSGNKP